MASEFEDEPPRKKGRVQQETSEHCPYLAEINRKLLDFDFEKLCSVSLSNLNVYGCLCCGKYFQGARSPLFGNFFHQFCHFSNIHFVFIRF
jgi:U4/U6.U5 tri-snRNP-associated protein 2